MIPISACSKLSMDKSRRLYAGTRLRPRHGLRCASLPPDRQAGCTGDACRLLPRSRCAAPRPEGLALAPRCRTTDDQDGSSPTKKLVLHVCGVFSSRILIDEMETPIINQILAVLRGLVPAFQDGHSSSQSDKATSSGSDRP